ncbi:MAG: arsenite efflux transporter metallochaperone ArsD [Planctomycetales bacterium]|nr:arsenite efflux transporter metallochaperone ArsD [Planctomycetales bacterium]
MKTIQVFDKPMCCSTGVCGPQVDPVLPRFAADLEWLKSHGAQVERFNLAHQPAAFTQNADVRELLRTEGTDCLPLVVVDGRVASRGQYPSRELLSEWAETGASARAELPVISDSRAGCCETGRC